MSYYTNYLYNLFTGLFDFFDRIFIQTGYIAWVGSAFLMYITYRFLVLPVFGSFSIASVRSDDINSFRRQKKVERIREQKKQKSVASARYNMQNNGD